MMRKLMCGTAVAALVSLSMPSNAGPVVWDFSVLGDQGVSHVFDSTPGGGGTVTLTAFGPGNPHLIGENRGPGEIGLGESNNVDNEIIPGSFIQIDLANLSAPPLASTHFSFAANSVQPGETALVYGSNTAGSLGTLIDTVTSDGAVSDLGAAILGVYRYLDVTAGKADVFLNEIDNSVIAAAVPEPATLGLLGVALLGLGLVRGNSRRIRRNGLG